MGDDIVLYKKNRVSELNTAYSVNLSVLNSTLNSSIKNIQSDRRLPSQIKQARINSLISKYFSNVNALKIKLNNDILSVNNYTPKKVTFAKNKKAAQFQAELVGVNEEAQALRLARDAAEAKNKKITHFCVIFIILKII